MVYITDKDIYSTIVPDEDLKIFNALLFLLSNKMHYGSFTIIETEKTEEICRSKFYYYDGCIEYENTLVSGEEQTIKYLKEEEIFDLILRTVRVLTRIGDPDLKADYYYVVDKNEESNLDIIGPQATAALKLIKEGKL